MKPFVLSLAVLAFGCGTLFGAESPCSDIQGRPLYCLTVDYPGAPAGALVCVRTAAERDAIEARERARGATTRRVDWTVAP